MSGSTQQLTERELVDAAWHLINEAARSGFVLTIERKPLLPLAMGNHEPVVGLSPVRNPAALRHGMERAAA